MSESTLEDTSAATASDESVISDAEMAALYENTLKNFQEGSIISGKVLEVRKTTKSLWTSATSPKA